jgi:prepilin-type N-terminal cleavage/methylation domain-containing protein
MTRRGTQSGVTLMELLVAVSLLSVLSLAMLFAMRIGLDAMSKTNNRVISNRRVLSVERILTAQVAGYIPTRVLCQPAPNVAGSEQTFFQGEPQTMRFVSSYSLQEGARGYPQILEFQVIPGEEGRGVRLVVNETLYAGLPSTLGICLGMQPDPATGEIVRIFRPVPIGPRSFVLADKLAGCTFGYKLTKPEPNEPDLWLPRWVGETAPTAVRIDLRPLDPDPAKLQVPPVVATIHPDRYPLADY